MVRKGNLAVFESSGISETGEASPTKIGVHAYDIHPVAELGLGLPGPGPGHQRDSLMIFIIIIIIIIAVNDIHTVVNDILLLINPPAHTSPSHI